jgi:hypothetical protein
MTTATFLFDTFSVAQRTLAPAALNEAICIAIRLGRNALEHERQAAFLVPLAQQHGLSGIEGPLDEDLADLIDACVPHLNEPDNQFVARLADSANLSAIRVTLAQLFQEEYGGGVRSAERGTERRRAIRKLCRAAPSEVWSDIVQGGLTPADADFLAQPDFTPLAVYAH